jgi:hypothetical protein
MFRVLSALFGLTFLLATAAAAALFLASEQEPLVAEPIGASSEEVRRAQNLLAGGAADLPADPERPRELLLTPRVLNVLADYIAGKIASGHARVGVAGGSAELAASLPVFWERRPYANIRLRLAQTEQAPRLVSASLGALPLPPGLLQWLALRWADDALDAAQWSGLLQRMEFGSDGVRVVYRSRSDLMEAASAGMAMEADRRRLLARQQQLAEIIEAQPRTGRLDLAVLLSALLARGDDAGAPDSDAQADNSAAILVIAAYVNGRRLPIADAEKDAANGHARPAPVRSVQLRGRRDLAQHFMASAAMVVGGGSTLSHMIGLSKELSDANGGSGFSFPDLMANRAGIRFAELATGSAAGAQHVQRLARVGLEQDTIMPGIEGLPEGLQRGALERALGDLGSPDYQRLLAYIDRRIGKVQLHLSAPRG